MIAKKSFQDNFSFVFLFILAVLYLDANLYCSNEFLQGEVFHL